MNSTHQIRKVYAVYWIRQAVIGASYKLCVDGVGVWECGIGGFFDENRRGCVVFAEKVAEREERGGLNEILGDEHTSGGV